MRLLSIVTAFIFITHTASAAPGAHGPNGEHITNEEKVVGQLGRQADGSVIMPMPTQAMLGIATQIVTETTISKTIKMSGVVRPHPEGHAVVQPSSDGRFEAPESGVLTSGKSVKAGQVLGYVHYQDTAYELASQNSELKVVRNQIAQTRRDVDRLKSLGELASKQELDQLQTQLKNLTEQEYALQQGLEKPEALVAPIGGTIINNNIRNGQWIEAGTDLFEIIALDLRLVDATTSEVAHLTSLSQATLLENSAVKLSYIGYSPRISGGLASVHFESRGEDDSAAPLLLGQPVTVIAPVDSSINGLVLPAKALVKNSANLPVVWIKVSAERFMPQAVRYQTLGENEIVVIAGLGADNRVVTAGASLLNQVR
ncbi:efflux RND transporter periplasmic adaptor subunit [Alteromonas sp. ASW11-19]|uniref:Efflux RND transporter periplasmic adaptor subunit n=1 Tax=Alteromonas salexigens TaxID=2982530 RepID=A0ABT2VQL0_9ALTE|nr:efflux RND transporter periplasmic adaptor subunit [Alteromonas salexigens]MCU7555405.1 efflux RND transporter periplasmic adaptor subunit [Alteromonas salexigens]